MLHAFEIRGGGKAALLLRGFFYGSLNLLIACYQL
jgi:hypothetical protein